MAAAQNTLTLLKNQDLQVAKNNGSSFAMNHSMGLANIKMKGSTTSGSKETLMLVRNTTTNQYSTNTSSNNEFYALDEFETNLPYKSGSRTSPTTLSCYFVVNPAKSYTFSTPYKYANSNDYKQWDDITVNSSSNTIASGNYKEITTSVPKFKNLGKIYNCTKACQTFTTPISSKYKIECWGASGGDATYGSFVNKGGRGGYTRGWITFSSARDLFVYVGEAGSYIPAANQSDDRAYKAETFNGGGAAQNYATVTATGGGATDVRITAGTSWDTFESLKSRIMVAAGGGGGNTYKVYLGGNSGDGSGGHAGGLTGGNGTKAWDSKSHTTESANSRTPSTGGKQDSGGVPLSGSHVGGGNLGQGLFGHGGTGTGGYLQGGGSGYYGGGSGGAIGGMVFSGAGGSSFISGYSECNAINYAASTSLSSMSHSGGSVLTINSESFSFAGSSPMNPTMISGNSTMPSPTSATANESSGHTGDGYCRITILPYD